jgi:hypothetical protein
MCSFCKVVQPFNNTKAKGRVQLSKKVKLINKPVNSRPIDIRDELKDLSQKLLVLMVDFPNGE